MYLYRYIVGVSQDGYPHIAKLEVSLADNEVELTATRNVLSVVHTVTDWTRTVLFCLGHSLY